MVDWILEQSINIGKGRGSFSLLFQDCSDSISFLDPGVIGQFSQSEQLESGLSSLLGDFSFSHEELWLLSLIRFRFSFKTSSDFKDPMEPLDRGSTFQLSMSCQCSFSFSHSASSLSQSMDFCVDQSSGSKCKVIMEGTVKAPQPPDLFLLESSFMIRFCRWIVYSAFFSRMSSSSAVKHLFTIGSFFMDFALCPNRNDVRVSYSLQELGDTFTIRFVSELPPRLSCRNRVSFESRYGIWVLLPSDRALMTFPKAVRLVLIFLASSSSLPSAPVLEIFSLPARSTRITFAELASPEYTSWVLKLIMKTIWDLEDSLFMLVTPTDRFPIPMLRQVKASSWDRMYFYVKFYRKMPYFLFERIFKSVFERSSKSFIFQLQIQTIEIFILLSMFLGLYSIVFSVYFINRGRMPACTSSLKSGPTQVKVLPEEVCPQQKIVPFKPWKAPATISDPTASQMAPWVESLSKIPSKVN